MGVFLSTHLKTCDPSYINHTSVKLRKNYDHVDMFSSIPPGLWKTSVRMRLSET